MPISLGLDQLLPGPRSSQLKLKCSADLFKLSGNKRRVLVTIGMVLDQNITGLVMAVLTYKPSRTFGEKPESDEVDDGGECLKSCRESPRPFGVDAVSAVCRPCCDDRL